MKRLFILLFILAAAAGSMFSKRYTVYIYDTGRLSYIESPQVHVWDAAGKPYKEWADNDHALPTSQYVEVSGLRCPLYSYTFEWESVPVGIKLHGPSGINAGDLEFHDGYLYPAYEGATGLRLSDCSTGPMIEKTLYFANNGEWPADGIRLHAWQTDARDYCRWADAPLAEDTGKFVRLGDAYYPCFAVTLTMSEPVTDLQWFRLNNPVTVQCMFPYDVSAELFWDIGHLQTGAGLPGPVELVDEIPSIPGEIWFHTGANEVLTGLWTRPCAHLYRKGDPEPTLDAFLALAPAEAMTRVEEGLWKITVDDIQKYNDVGFYYCSTNAAGRDTVKSVFRASTSPYFDAGTYARYIYDIGTVSPHPSYMTPAQYIEMSANPPENIYMIGNTPLGFPDDDWNLRTCEALVPDNGVYVRQLTAGEQGRPGMFKLSRVDVSKYVREAGAEATYQNQRGWATFNLNLIGAETRGFDWIVTGKPVGFNNRVVFTPCNNSLPYNKFNQYEWCVSSNPDWYPGFDPIVPGNDYWLVIDTHDAGRSVSLLSFKPEPSVKIQNPAISTVDIGYDRAAALQDGLGLHAASASGHVFFDKINVVVGRVEVTATGNDVLSHNNYSVVYTVYANGEPFLALDYVPEDGIEVPFLPLGDDLSLTVRARYTNNKTLVSFCSGTGDGETFGAPELPAPTVGDPDVQVYIGTPGDDCPEGSFALGTRAAYPYAVESDYISYADYDLDITPASPSALIALYNPAGGWTPWPGATTVYTDDYNWSKAVSDSGLLPIDHANVGYVDFETLQSDFTLGLTAYAVYPFLVRDLTASSASVSRSSVSKAPNAEIPEDLSGYTIVPARVAATHTKSLADAALTAVRDITADTAVAAEYYTLQGVRVPSPDAPGIYIERRGAHTRKIAVGTR